MKHVNFVRRTSSQFWRAIRWYFLSHSYPAVRAGLRALPIKERWRLIRLAHGQAYRHWQTWLGLLLALLAFLSALWLVRFNEFAAAWWIFIVQGFVGISIHINSRKYFAEKTLCEMFTNLCSQCGYDLRATPERCPECGTVPAKTLNSN